MDPLEGANWLIQTKLQPPLNLEVYVLDGVDGTLAGHECLCDIRKLDESVSHNSVE